MKSLFAVLALALAASSALAGQPPGHPSPAAAADMLNLPKDAALTQKGKVVSSINANEYTYIEVAQAGKTLWIAAPLVQVKKDSVIRFEDGAVMTNFRSKLLNRVFPSVMFVNKVVVTNEKL
jgi:hypothetical protein